MLYFANERIHKSWFVCVPLTMLFCIAAVVLWPRMVPAPALSLRSEPDVPFIAAVRKAGYYVVFHREEQPAFLGLWYVTRTPRPVEELRSIHAFVPCNSERYEGVVLVVVDADSGNVQLLGDAELCKELDRLR